VVPQNLIRTNLLVVSNARVSRSLSCFRSATILSRSKLRSRSWKERIHHGPSGRRASPLPVHRQRQEISAVKVSLLRAEGAYRWRRKDVGPSAKRKSRKVRRVSRKVTLNLPQSNAGTSVQGRAICKCGAYLFGHPALPCIKEWSDDLVGHVHANRTIARAGWCTLHSLALASCATGLPGDVSVSGGLFRGRRDSWCVDLAPDRSKFSGVSPTQLAPPNPGVSSSIVPTLNENHAETLILNTVAPLRSRTCYLPGLQLTPGDAVPGVTDDEVCTPGWASEHRHVTESMRDQVYAEYGRARGPGCCRS